MSLNEADICARSLSLLKFANVQLMSATEPQVTDSPTKIGGSWLFTIVQPQLE
ncbi:MAG TPA: hypothetical protein V6C91_09805 [Coleofasciculaceae cyanobacterium]